MGSDYCRVWRPNIVVISIHAPRMGSDAGVQALQRLAAYFNPRSPNGERPLPSPSSTCPSKFQSTLPEWGATTAQHPGEPSHHISIHAPRMGSDGLLRPGPLPLHAISIHAPRMGSDRENGHLRPRYGQNHPFSTLIVSQIVVDVLGTVRKSQKTPAH